MIWWVVDLGTWVDPIGDATDLLPGNTRVISQSALAGKETKRKR